MSVINERLIVYIDGGVISILFLFLIVFFPVYFLFPLMEGTLEILHIR